MPTVHYQTPFDKRLPLETEKQTAKQLSAILSARLNDDEPVELDLHLDDQRTTITLLPGLARLLVEVLDHVGSGHAVQIMPREHRVTTQEAADMLNVSRPYLVKKLLGTGELPFEKVGRHRRLRVEDVLAYRERRDAVRTRALNEIAALDLEEN